MRMHTKARIQSLCTILAIILLCHCLIEAEASDFKYENPAALQTTSESFEILPDPHLQSEIELHIQGESNEFNASHVNWGTHSYVNLTWIHTSGTELQLTQIPELWEFCYFTTSFQWEIERLPTDAMFYISYGVHTTGDFNSTEGETMFNVHAWFIDSSDEWNSLYESVSPYSTTVQEYSYDLNYFDLMNGWRGMVEDDSGYQENPEDILQIGVGLAPSEGFDTCDDGGHPWQEYNGSVSALVHSLSLIVTMEPETSASIIEPYYVVAPIGIISAVIVAYLVWRRYYKA
jgi:hypothetical protein